MITTRRILGNTLWISGEMRLLKNILVRKFTNKISVSLLAEADKYIKYEERLFKA